MKERIRAIPQAAQNGCSAFPLLRYLSFQCTSVRAGPPSSAPEQFSWTVNRNRVTGCGHMAPLDEALPGTPLLLPQPALSHGDHTPLLLPQPALSHGGHTEHLCGMWFPPEAALGSLWSFSSVQSLSRVQLFAIP